MAFDYSEIRAVGIDLIKEFGRACVLLRPTEAAPADATMPWRLEDGTEAEIEFLGVLEFASLDKRSGNADQTSGDLYCPGDLGVEPTTNDRIRVIGTFLGETDPEFAITGVTMVNPDDTAIMYQLRLSAWPDDIAGPAQ